MDDRGPDRQRHPRRWRRRGRQPTRRRDRRRPPDTLASVSARGRPQPQPPPTRLRLGHRRRALHRRGRLRRRVPFRPPSDRGPATQCPRTRHLCRKRKQGPRSQPATRLARSPRRTRAAGRRGLGDPHRRRTPAQSTGPGRVHPHRRLRASHSPPATRVRSPPRPSTARTPRRGLRSARNPCRTSYLLPLRTSHVRKTTRGRSSPAHSPCIPWPDTRAELEQIRRSSSDSPLRPERSSNRRSTHSSPT